MSLVARIAGKLDPALIHRISSLRYRYPWTRGILERVARAFKNQDLVIQHGIGKGLRFNCGDALAGYAIGSMEYSSQHLLTSVLRPGMVAFDIGANVGFYSVLMAHLVGPTGRVICFEPLPANARQLAHNAALNSFRQIEICVAAVGAAEGEADFDVARALLPGAYAEGEKIRVPVRALDEWVAKDRGLPPAFIKMDVEGAEVAVLDGARDVLRSSRPVVLVELHDTNRAVSRILHDLDYVTYVRGSTGSIEDAHWNAHVLAVPRERTDLADVGQRFQMP